MATPAAVATTWVTYVPCFLWILLGAAVATCRLHVGMLPLLAGCAAVGVLWRLWEVAAR